MVPATILCLLLPLVQGSLVSLSTQDSLGDLPYQIDSVDPQYGKFTKIVTLSSDAKPLCGALRNDNTFVYSALYATNESALNIVDLNTGKIQEGQRYSSYVFDNIAFDKVTNQTFVTAYSASNPLFELLPNQTLRKIADFPQPFSVFISAYSSDKHLFFLLSREDEHELRAVNTVGAQEGKIIYDVKLSLGVYSLVFDDTFGVLYAWGYDDTYKAILVSVDYTTGKTLKTFYQAAALFASPSGACINTEGTIFYSSMYDRTFNASVFFTMELATNNNTLVPAARYAKTLSFFF